MSIADDIRTILKTMAEERGCHCCEKRYDCPDAVRDPYFCAGEKCSAYKADWNVTNDDVQDWIDGN